MVGLCFENLDISAWRTRTSSNPLTMHWTAEVRRFPNPHDSETTGREDERFTNGAGKRGFEPRHAEDCPGQRRLRSALGQPLRPPTLKATGDDQLAADIQRPFPFPYLICSRTEAEPPHHPARSWPAMASRDKQPSREQHLQGGE